MFYDAINGHHGLKHNPIKALVAPRPIGWITALDGQGRINCAPYSFFNLVADEPAMVMFSSNGHKDSQAFIEETGEFTCSIATYALKDAMNATSATLPRGQNEMIHAGLEAAPSRVVRPPWVKGAPAALECRLAQVVPIKPLVGTSTYTMLIGQVVAVHIDDAYVADGRVNVPAMVPIARGGYHDYYRADEASVFSLGRPA